MGTGASVTTTADPVSTPATTGSAVTTTDVEECESIRLDTPESDTLTFPPFPAELTRAPATDWAHTFEEAYRIDDVRASYGTFETVFRPVPAWSYLVSYCALTAVGRETIPRRKN